MCTVVFIPINNRVYLGSLRDESPSRPKAINPEIYQVSEMDFLAPKDQLAGGTWIGVNSSGNSIILLNGGFENHTKKNNYRKSRGLIVFELLATKLPVEEWDLIDMEDIEPFTLIVWSYGKLFQLVWDGEQRHKLKLNAKHAYIWSSSTLYKKDVKAFRQQLFEKWIATNPVVNKFSLFNFFKSFNNTENGFVMNRNDNTKTLSFSFIELADNTNAIMSYYDFLKSAYDNKTLTLKQN